MVDFNWSFKPQAPIRFNGFDDFQVSLPVPMPFNTFGISDGRVQLGNQIPGLGYSMNHVSFGLDGADAELFGGNIASVSRGENGGADLALFGGEVVNDFQMSVDGDGLHVTGSTPDAPPEMAAAASAGEGSGGGGYVPVPIPSGPTIDPGYVDHILASTNDAMFEADALSAAFMSNQDPRNLLITG